MAPRSSASPLPRSLYRQYKQSTEFFKKWLLRARDSGVGASPLDAAEKDPLRVYERVVAAIARELMALSPSQLQLWPRALEACATAITACAGGAVLSNDPWRFARALPLAVAQVAKTLEHALLPTKAERRDAPTTGVDVHSLDFSNYYDVLALPDDYFVEDDVLWTTPEVASPVPPLTSAERARLFDEAFAEDLNAELACLLMELEELSEAVYAAYFDVKQQKKTLVEATCVAKIAMDSAASVIAQLQLRYPSIRDAQGLMTVIQDRVPHEALAKQLATVLQAWWPPDKKKKKKYQYVAGTLLVDVLWVARALLSFVLVIPAAAQTKLVVRDGFFGHTYSEEDTPHYTAPDMTSKPAFLSQQLPLLLNVLLANRASGIPSDTSSFTGWFLDQFDSLSRLAT